MNDTNFTFEHCCDDLGPALVYHIYDPRSDLRAIVVVDNVARGPAIGGIRMASDVSVDEVRRLARAMTLKNAAADLPHGGGKSGILADPKTADKERLIRAFGNAVRHLVDYFPGPDMGTDESCMAWLYDETGRVVGRPRDLGGIPLDEIGATGYGVAQCAVVAAPFCDLELRGAMIAVEGFGNVGRPAARFLEEMGARLVAASDTGGAVYNGEGIPVDELVKVKQREGSVTKFENAEKIAAAELFSVPHDILIPAARPDSIHDGNVESIPAKLILQGANIPATASAEERLHDRGVLVVPDFIANAGGVICAAMEYQGASRTAAMEIIEEKITYNVRRVLETARAENCTTRKAAEDMAHRRVRRAMALRRWSLF